jgi:hypothetical protein
VTAAGFNRRIRKTISAVVWQGDRAQSPSLDLIIASLLNVGLVYLRAWAMYRRGWLPAGLSASRQRLVCCPHDRRMGGYCRSWFPAC